MKVGREFGKECKDRGTSGGEPESRFWGCSKSTVRASRDSILIRPRHLVLRSPFALSSPLVLASLLAEARASASGFTLTNRNPYAW